MYPIITGAIIIILTVALAVIVYVLLRYHEDNKERASDDLELKCGRCGKDVYKSRTGIILRPFTVGDVRCDACRKRNEIKKVLGQS